MHKIFTVFVYFYVCPTPLTRPFFLSESVVFTFIEHTKVAFCVDEVGARHEKNPPLKFLKISDILYCYGAILMLAVSHVLE